MLISIAIIFAGYIYYCYLTFNWSEHSQGNNKELDENISINYSATVTESPKGSEELDAFDGVILITAEERATFIILALMIFHTLK